MKTKNSRKILPIILSGGSGTRIWPLSRKSFPKQFWNLHDENGLSLLQKTIKRLDPLENILESKPAFLRLSSRIKPIASSSSATQTLCTLDLSVIHS